MGMNQSANYGADFVNSMAATAGMFNDRRRLDLDEKKQAGEQQTRELQQKGLELDNQKKSTDMEKEKRLGEFLDLSSRMENGSLHPDDYGKLAGVTAGVMKDTPYLPNDPAEIPKYKQAVTNLISGVQNLRTLPASNYRYTREDNVPEINSALDSFQTLLSKDRLGREFVDNDGSITGTPGSTYKTSGVGGFVMTSGEGDKAAFTPYFSIMDADGQPLLDAAGKQRMVPSTMGETNDPNAELRKITPEEMLTKAGFAYHLLDTSEKLGLADPVKRKQYISSQLLSSMGPKGAEDFVKRSQDRSDATDLGTALRKTIPNASPKDQPALTIAADLLDGGHAKDITSALAIAKTIKPEKTVQIYKDGDVGVDPTTNQPVFSNKKAVVPPPTHTVKRTRNGVEYEDTDRWNPQTEKYDTIASVKLRQPTDPAIAENKRSETQSKAAIDKSISELTSAKSRLAAARKTVPVGTSDPVVRAAEQELEDASTAYRNRTAEHKQTFGREYSPIKEVVDRRPERDITPLKDGFAEKGGTLIGRRDYPTFIADAELQGWTPEEMKRAAKDTGAERAVNEYFAGQRTTSRPAPQPAAQGTQPASKQSDSRPPLSSFLKRTR